jgi:hypothetical protein
VFAGILWKWRSLPTWLDRIWVYHRRLVLFFDFIFHVKIDYAIQSENIRRKIFFFHWDILLRHFWHIFSFF